MSVNKSWIEIFRGGLLFIFYFIICHAFAQESVCETSANKKAMKYYEEAADLFKSRKYED